MNQNGTQIKNNMYLCTKIINTDIIMVIVTGRDFRANTAKYVDVALRGEDVVVKSRAALIEAKDSIEGKRKLNTLDHLINELRNSNE